MIIITYYNKSRFPNCSLLWIKVDKGHNHQGVARFSLVGSGTIPDTIAVRFKRFTETRDFFRHLYPKEFFKTFLIFEFARENWKPLLDKYNVDLVLNGHDHTYARGHVPVRTSDSDTPELGTVYVTSVSGPKQYGLDRKQILAYKSQGYRSDKTAEQTQFFQVISIEDNTLSYVAYTVTGDEYDRATITKDFATGKKSLKD